MLEDFRANVLKQHCQTGFFLFGERCGSYTSFQVLNRPAKLFMKHLKFSPEKNNLSLKILISLKRRFHYDPIQAHSFQLKQLVCTDGPRVSVRVTSLSKNNRCAFVYKNTVKSF